VFEIREASKRFGSVVALAGCSFQAGRGRILGFLGPNGAGKTTAMRSIFGLVRLDAGQLFWDQRPISHRDQRRFGYMPEARGLYPRMKTLDQVCYFAQLHGMDLASARQSAASMLERLGLSDQALLAVEELSHGNQQRVQLAVALVNEPELLVLDEPFSGLDPVGVAALGAVIREEAARGAAIVFSSHQLDLVQELCDDVAIISRGNVVLTGALQAVQAASPSRYVQFITGAMLTPDQLTHWARGLVDAEIVSMRGSEVRLRVPSSTQPESIVEAVGKLGAIISFRFEPPNLSDLFMKAVGA
jgi:ABC-2 type transport system ATP-binding protein